MSVSNILIVEDESIVALDLQAILIRLGYHVTGIAGCGDEAIQMAAERQPDLALMDIRLRGSMDGVKTAWQLHERFAVPVIYLTAYADETTLQRAKFTEPLGYLLKPFEERELRSTIEMALYRIEAGKRAQAQTDRLERIISAVPEGVALLDSNHRLVQANARAQAYLDDLAGVAVGDILDRLGAYSIEQLLYMSDDSACHEIRIGEASPRIFEAGFSPVHPNSGSRSPDSSEWVLMIREVTTERQLQQRMQAQDRLAAVGQFAAGIAHDFNNILASIMVTPYMIQKLEPELSAKSRDRLDMLAQQAKRASDLIQQILDFSRTSDMEMQNFDLLPLLKEIMQMLERMLPETIVVRFIYPPDDYRLNGDSTRILQLMMNLTLNARDAMPDGGELTVELARVFGEQMHLNGSADHSTWIRICVSDNGTGIHPDALPHIFEPFFTTKPAGKGTGLGLAQVYGIVQQHNGHITVGSQIGQGTTFSVFLPALYSSASVTSYSVNAATFPIQGGQQTILLVEDNPAVRQTISEILELSNYHVLTASNGCEALARLDSPAEQVDLILSDLIMPEMGGLELCRELKHKRQDLRIIILSGYVADDAREELVSLGVASLLKKPIEVEQLLRAIEGA
nr:response regulator [Nitrosomonas nitrosa]